MGKRPTLSAAPISSSDLSSRPRRSSRIATQSHGRIEIALSQQSADHSASKRPREDSTDRPTKRLRPAKNIQSKTVDKKNSVPGWSQSMCAGKKLLRCLQCEFKRVAAQDPRYAKTAVSQSKYLRNQFCMHGFKAAERKQLEKPIFVLPEHTIKSEEELQFCLLELWSYPERDYQYSAMTLAMRYQKLWSCNMLATFEHMIRHKSWWDTVDLIASNMVGGLVGAQEGEERERLRNLMDDWTSSDDMWIRRAGLLHQLKFAANTDDKQLFRHCVHLMPEQDFFIRKAIGWALRQYSKTDKQAVQSFVDSNRTGLSKLSVREASKYL